MFAALRNRVYLGVPVRAAAAIHDRITVVVKAEGIVFILGAELKVEAEPFTRLYGSGEGKHGLGVVHARNIAANSTVLGAVCIRAEQPRVGFIVCKVQRTARSVERSVEFVEGICGFGSGNAGNATENHQHCKQCGK